MLSHIRALAVSAVLAVTAGVSAQAATLGFEPTNNPLLRAENVTLISEPDYFYAAGDISSAFAGGGTLDPLPSDFVIEGFAFDDLVLNVFLDSGVDAFLSGEVLSAGFVDGVIELLFATMDDVSGLFGPRIMVLLTAGNTAFPSDPLTTAFEVDDASASITTPVPLPAGLPLLLGALVALQLARRRVRN